MNSEDPSFLPKTGNYQELLSYQKSEIVYDLTFRFCERLLHNYRDRTVDQMIQDILRDGAKAHQRRQGITRGTPA